MENAEVIKHKNYLLNNLILHNDYNTTKGLKRVVLMVEGKTDEAFIEKVLNHDVRCLPVVDFLKTKNTFTTSPKTLHVNYKEVITTILLHIAMFPEICDFPKGAETWPLYGLVDNDFKTEDKARFSRVYNLFFTDTHDIETLMLSTDPELLTNLKQCTIRADEIKIALYLANQLAYFRRAITKNGELNPHAISNAEGDIDFPQFMESDRISLPLLLNYINRQSDLRLSKARLKRALDKIAEEMGGLIDKERKWKKPFSIFSAEENDDLWMNINGHDVLAAIRFVNDGAREAFSNKSGYSQNRSFEFALSETYNYSKFRSTRLYSKLAARGLLAGGVEHC